MKINNIKQPNDSPSFQLLWGYFILSFFVQFVISPDSYTHDLTGHVDSAWFYTCGKAWMNGMVPYVDFADSKGPLLWLIYGIGYLIHKHSYIGVFWLSVINYTFIFYYVHKTAYLFLKNSELAFFTVLIMVSSFFCPWYHGEIRAEDWCQLFIVMSFYRTCLLLYTEKGKLSPSIYMTCFCVGFCFAGTLLIKYNVTAMIGCIALYTLYAIIRERKNIPISILSFILGGLSLSMPFIIYMIIEGNLNSFLNEYFFNTFRTIQSYNSKSMYLREWLYLTYDTHYVIIFVISLIGVLRMSKIVNSYNYFFIITFLGFYGIAIHHSEYLHWHYLASCLFFPIWLCISIIHNSVEGYKKESRNYIVIITTILLIYTISSNFFEWGYLSQNWFFRNNTTRKEFYNVAYYLSQKRNATIIYYKMMDLGFGTPTNCLPGTKYWATQKGATDNMQKSVHEAILTKKTDFIMTYDHDQSIEDSNLFLNKAGYKQVYCFKMDKYNYALFSKYQLQTPPQNFNIDIWDVLFKRDIFKE